MDTMQEVEVVRESDLKDGYSTHGITRDKAFETENVIFSRTRIAAGKLSGWHHHATRHLYGFVIHGRLRLEYSSEGSKVAELKVGDFFDIPPGLVHRDVNPDEKNEALIVNILVGEGAAVVNVPNPQK